MSWIDYAEVLTPEDIAKLKSGQVLVFEYEGSPAWPTRIAGDIGLLIVESWAARR